MISDEKRREVAESLRELANAVEGGRRGLGVTRLRQWGERGIASGPALSPRSRPCGANLP